MRSIPEGFVVFLIKSSRCIYLRRKIITSTFQPWKTVAVLSLFSVSLLYNLEWLLAVFFLNAPKRSCLIDCIMAYYVLVWCMFRKQFITEINERREQIDTRLRLLSTKDTKNCYYFTRRNVHFMANNL